MALYNCNAISIGSGLLHCSSDGGTSESGFSRGLLLGVALWSSYEVTLFDPMVGRVTVTNALISRQKTDLDLVFSLLSLAHSQ